MWQARPTTLGTSSASSHRKEAVGSIAILLSEYARKIDASPVIQLFASDLDYEAIGIAREGLYLTAIAFTVRLPLSEVEPAEPPSAPTPQASLRTLSDIAPRVLVADDNADTAWSISTLLQISGCQVSTCFDGPSAVQAARQAMPDVAVLDIGMPDMRTRGGTATASPARRRPGAAGKTECYIFNSKMP